MNTHVANDLNFCWSPILYMYNTCTKLVPTKVYMIYLASLGPVVNILAIFSNANILKNKIIKRYHIKGIGCQLLISINIDFFDQETEK